MKKSKSKILITMLGMTVAILQMQAQNVTLPGASQYASITQRVGISDITIVYHSPANRMAFVRGSAWTCMVEPRKIPVRELDIARASAYSSGMTSNNRSTGALLGAAV